MASEDGIKDSRDQQVKRKRQIEFTLIFEESRVWQKLTRWVNLPEEQTVTRET